MVTWKGDRIENKNSSNGAGVNRTKLGSSLTIKHSTAVLSGRGQRLTGVVQFVAIVTDADLKLYWLAGVLNHGGAVEDCTETELPPPLVFLLKRENRA